MGRLDGLRALVTGGTSGIGTAIVERLRRDGAAVVFTGRDVLRGADVASASGSAFVRADATDASQVESSLREALELLGGLDALVLNAGVLYEAPLSETTDAAWDAVLETNVVAPYRYSVAALPELRAAGGSITMISSDAGVWPEVPIGAYSVSKRALNMLTQMLAMEAGPAGVRVNGVCPGDTAPGMATYVDGREEVGDTSGWLLPPAGRIGTADDVAGAVAFFVSADGSFCNGSVLLVDGGMRSAVRSTLILNGPGKPGYG